MVPPILGNSQMGQCVQFMGVFCFPELGSIETAIVDRAVDKSHPLLSVSMGGCQNYHPLWDPYYNTAPDIQGTQKGTIILTTTRMIYSTPAGMA